MKILHLSDLHFGKPFLPDVGDILLTQAAALTPDIIVVSGDLTQRAKPGEYENARSFLDRLPEVPRVVIPGNHDIPLYRVWERLLKPRALYRRYIRTERNVLLHLDGAIIVGLDSTDPYRGIKNGRLSRKQLNFCKAAFAEAPSDGLRIVVMHHHLIPAPTFKPTRPMPNAKGTLEALTRMRVDVVMAGHLHRAYVGNSLDVYTGRKPDHGIIMVQCGTSTSRRGRGLEREKNSFNHIELTAEMIRVIHYHYIETLGRFASVSRHEFARPGRLHLSGQPYSAPLRRDPAPC